MDCLDILETIGSYCDPKTRMKLCMADRQYLQSQKVFIKEQHDLIKGTFVTKVKNMLEECMRTRSLHARLRKVHVMYRYITESSDQVLFLMSSSRFIRAAVDKLDQLVNPSGKVRMGKVPAKKYKKVLERYL